jgi:hypothetical protein
MDIQGQVSFLSFFHSHVCNPHMGVNRGQMVIQWAVKAQMVIQYVYDDTLVRALIYIYIYMGIIDTLGGKSNRAFERLGIIALASRL